MLVTTDQSLRYQRKLKGRRIGIVVLLSSNWPALRRRIKEVAKALAAVRPGEVVEVPFGLPELFFGVLPTQPLHWMEGLCRPSIGPHIPNRESGVMHA